ncbi:hypothetical protein [Bradyrhizobium canariense]|uniref:hypothetical protein n=1 Tax=Bradyrhizobium canariense TaxID=255045 RepID=UPI000A196B50|nr:hypothetical protein [Bradyrhizobium canariense]OSI24376.1 hypothetical protein BST65_17640 [Bradyrhizobium canariense]OSI29669.1 hypothetical protein BST66_25150 [Bradyrhizobium canariense]OSI46500.1 hypothetical protein BSZ20_10745 [Bradyrhizobium canariense]OSI53941.1 hypothetical protein BST67_08155 [Bradyrhizobium canariense]OSI56889.1 hypothetical protein BSZ15_15645 [Bradyrhizobium canariense]
MEVEPHIQSVSEATLARSAQTLVSNAVAAAFNEDPVIGPDLSRAISVVGSVVKRHGLLLQNTAANALAASGRFDVLVDVAIPIVDAASELLLARNSVEDLARINIRADASAERIVNVDLVVIDPEVGWAGVYDVKRGNGPVDGRTRRPIEHDLRAAGMVLASYLAKRGYRNISRITAGVIDYYGATGFSKDFKISREELDGHFQVPIRATLDKVTACLREALLAELPHLFSDVIKTVNRETAEKNAANCGIGLAPDPLPGEAPVVHFANARPTGPGPRKSAATVKIGGAA